MVIFELLFEIIIGMGVLLIFTLKRLNIGGGSTQKNKNE
jgi:hypothetical protein